jgi:hypothetical protein
MKRNKELILIGLMSVTLISLEIIWTRIFSAEFFYNFAFLVLSLAVLGLGLGALAVRFFPFLNAPNHLGMILSITGFFALIGPTIILRIGFKFSKLFSHWGMLGKFIVILFLLSSAFFTGGCALALLFKRYHQEMPRLYMADLIGAGTGVFLAVLLMNLLGTPIAAVLLCLPILLAAFIAGKGRHRLVPLILAILTVSLIPFSETLVDTPSRSGLPLIYQYWDAMSKIKIYAIPRRPDIRGINIDNVAGTTVHRFDGNWDRPPGKRFRLRVSANYLIKQMKGNGCTFMSLGAGGGEEVLQALQEGAVEIHAVEVNAHINYLLQTGELADFSGNIYHDPRVEVVTEDARAYVRRFNNKFDLIYSLSSNTFTALASGAFAMAENYLFTTEAFRDYYRALTHRGFMVIEHRFYMPRIVSEALDALTDLEVENPKNHIAVYHFSKSGQNVLLFSKAPLTEDIRQNAFGKSSPVNQEKIRLLYPAEEGDVNNLINRIVLKGWKCVADEATIDISPSTDKRPFTPQMGKWKNFSFDSLGKLSLFSVFRGFPLSKVLICIILIVIFVLILPLNLLPYLTKGEKLPFLGWLYFFAVGAGFMIVEVILIQRYTRFIGPSSYTIIVTLFTLLLASGIGSRFTGRFNDKIPFIAIFLWILLEITIFFPLTNALGSLTMVPRILVSIVLIFPLGFFMGMPFPKGTKRVGNLIDWGFAVNGAASVLGATSIYLVSFSYGFDISLLIGAVCYLTAFLLLNLKKNWLKPVK